ncbi:MAG: SAM-dependent methyltransferase [Gammaproteobacteria bacterium]|jgi:SAM-dependent methyltransferase
MNTDHAREIDAGSRFEFGRNWRQFLASVDEQRIQLAMQSLQSLLGRDVAGARFLDVGSGSGLFSLAARRLGATVLSFDFDPESVACTSELRRLHQPNDPQWSVERGSALDRNYLATLGQWDIVYSWGVLHHTGSMWDALEQISDLVAENGMLALGLYNDQGRASAMWLRIKQLYNRLPSRLRWVVMLPAAARLWGPTSVRDLFKGAPLQTWSSYARDSVRGMSPWHDLVDWVGGLPFEVAKPEQLLDFYRPRGFELTKLKTCAGGIGCNEFVFRRRATQKVNPQM